MFTSTNKFNPQLLDRIGGTLKGGTQYNYQTILSLDLIVGDPQFFVSSNGNFGAGDTLTIMRYEGVGPLPVDRHELKEKVTCVVVKANRDGVYLLPEKYLDIPKAWAAYEASQKPPKPERVVEWNVGRRGYDVIEDGKVVARFGKDEKELAEQVARGEVPLPVAA